MFVQALHTLQAVHAATHSSVLAWRIPGTAEPGHHTRGLALSQPRSHLCRMTSSEPVFGGTAPGQGWDRHWLLPRAGAEATLTCRRSCLRLPAPPLPQTCPGHAACLGGGGCASTRTGGHPWGWGALPSSLGSAQCPSHPALRPPAGRDPYIRELRGVSAGRFSSWVATGARQHQGTCCSLRLDAEPWKAGSGDEGDRSRG